MRIEQPHALGRKEAVGRVDRFLERLIQAPPAGTTISDVRKHWKGGRLTLSFAIARGFFGAAFNGTLDVADDHVVVDAELPALVTSIVGEERIKQVIAEHLGQVLK